MPSFPQCFILLYCLLRKGNQSSTGKIWYFFYICKPYVAFYSTLVIQLEKCNKAHNMNRKNESSFSLEQCYILLNMHGDFCKSIYYFINDIMYRDSYKHKMFNQSHF